MPTVESERLLLDTHVWLWLVNGRPELDPSMAERIQAAGLGAGLYIQVFSVWEVAMLESKGRIQVSVGLEAWAEQALGLPGLRLVPLAPAIAIASTRLPGRLPSDPADRILVATAREYSLTLVTRDAALLDYGRSGHLRVLAA
ncbi:MAG TPA: type II toxin-antitoxin system VapC family toxin [Terriglobales bacterium]|nr:type II toxin-antitoxin system VapC family toxin [Terriglobales bacterium]